MKYIYVMAMAFLMALCVRCLYDKNHVRGVAVKNGRVTYLAQSAVIVDAPPLYLVYGEGFVTILKIGPLKLR